MAEKIGVGILGCGVVGSAVAKILVQEREHIAERTGIELDLRHVVVRDVDKKRSIDLPAGVLSADPGRLTADAGTHIVVELIGGADTAADLIRRSLSVGKSVVTANKALLAMQGAELFAAARAAGQCIAFEASVAGGIPVIDSLRRGLQANEIDAVYGILNGTCNYILTRMLEERVGYREVLSEAQALGYAEADPALDVDGTDSAHKLAILASLALRRSCAFDKILIRGITDLDLTDLVAGEELGYVCKLLAIARHHDDGLDLSVQPTFIHTSHPLAGVSGPFNAVSVYGNAVGHVLLYGRGAGGGPTASAVVADIIDLACGNAARTFDMPGLLPDQTPPATYRPAGENETPFYIRVGLEDLPGRMATVATFLGDEGISISSIVQHEHHGKNACGAIPVVAITHPTRDRQVQAAIRRMNDEGVVVERVVCMPVLDEHTEVHPY